jgi:hypothetical protein
MLKVQTSNAEVGNWWSDHFLSKEMEILWKRYGIKERFNILIKKPSN